MDYLDAPRYYSGEVAYYYIIQEGKNGPIKLGYTSDLKKRLETLQTGNSKKLAYYYWTYIEGYVDRLILDFQMKDEFKEFKVRGEWYKVSKRKAKKYLTDGGISLDSDS